MDRAGGGRPRRGVILAGIVLMLMATCFVATAHAQVVRPTLPAGFEEYDIASGFSHPTAFAYAPDGRIFVTEKPGRLRVVVPGQGLRGQPVLDISTHVNWAADRGLLGLALDKDFATNGWIYLLYTYEHAPGDPNGRKVSRLTRITVNANNTVANPSSPETVILGKSSTMPCPQASNTSDCIPADYYWHTIGTVKVDPADGTLWVGTGDATYSLVVDEQTYGTYDETSFRGKILHIDKNGRGLPGHPFCPSDTNLDNVCTKIYAKGFRNPFRFSLRPGKGPVVGDVGAADREEIDLIEPGKNYGWPCYEGDIRNPVYDDQPRCAQEFAKEGTAQASTAPAWAYEHGDGASVAGGPAYSGSGYPSSYRGDVFAADFAQGWIKRLKLDSSDRVTSVQPFASWPAGQAAAVDIQQLPNGDIAYLDIGYAGNDTGIRAFRYAPGNASPIARATGSPLSGPSPLAVTFDASGSTDADGDSLSYSWAFGDGTTGTGAKPSHTYSKGGTYTATVTVTDGRGGSATATVGPIGAGNSPPTAQITSPAAASKYLAGSSISVAGSGTDAEDGNLTGTKLAWNVYQRHGNHTHDLTSFTGATGSFDVGTDHDADSYLLLELTVTDAGGLSDSQTIQIDPQTVAYTLASSPAGAQLSYDNGTAAAPFTRTAASGYRVTVGAADSFVKNGDTYEFKSWSDSGARSHTVSVPNAAATLTASYNGIPTAAATADSTSGAAPLAVKFDGSGSRDPDASDTLTYDWDFGDGSAHGTGAKPPHTYATVGHYTATLTVSDGRGGSAVATIAIAPGDSPPTASISAPANGARFDAGGTLSMTGSGTDPQDGNLPGSALGWVVTLHRGTTATAQPAVTGANATLAVPRDFPVDGWYEIALTATDSAGLTNTKTVRVDPRVATIALGSDPAGVPLTWNGAQLQSTTAVVGSVAALAAPAAHSGGGRSWLFASWSDGGAREHEFTVPVGASSLTASYSAVVDPPGGDAPPAGNGTQPSGPSEPPPGQPPVDVPAPPPLIDLALPRAGVRASAKGVVRITLGNRNPLASIGVLRVTSVSKLRTGRSRAKRIGFGEEAFIIAPHDRRAIALRLSKTDLKLLRKLRRLEVTVTFDGHDRSGRKGRGSARTVLLAPKR